jgi:hypothetical protein
LHQCCGDLVRFLIFFKWRRLDLTLALAYLASTSISSSPLSSPFSSLHCNKERALSKRERKGEKGREREKERERRNLSSVLYLLVKHIIAYFYDI